MRWLSVITSEDLGLSRGTPEQLEALIRRLPKDLVVLKALQCAAALGVDKKAAYKNVDAFLLRSAPAALLDRIQGAKTKDPDAIFIFFEPWQQLLLARHAQRFGGTADVIVPLDSREGLDLLFDACRYINDLSMPPAPLLVGDPVTDALIVAANSIPRLWLMNPPNLNNSVARLLIFLDELPRSRPDLQPSADALRERFVAELGVPFEEALSVTAFLGYWSIAPSVDQVLADLRTVRIDPAAWLSRTTILPATLERLFERIAQSVDALAEPPPPGIGGEWFDPLSFRNRPLVRFPDGSVVVTMPEFLEEKASFEIFWWLTGGPGAPHQVRAWQQALGRLCEAYVIETLTEIAATDGVRMLPNLGWDGGELDALVWHAGHMAVVEVSGGFLPNAPKMSGNHEQLREALRRRYVEHVYADGDVEHEAVFQLARDIEWLATQRRANVLGEVPLREIEAIYPVLIAADRTVRTHGVWRYLDAELRQRLPDMLPWRVAPLAVLGLEDLEWIQQAVRDRHPRLTQTIPGFLQILLWWEFEVNRPGLHRHKAIWQLLEDALGEGAPNARLAVVSKTWLGRMKSLFLVPGGQQ